MSELRIEKINLPSADFNGVSTLPEISKKSRLASVKNVFELDEEDGLFVNYGNVKYAFPYLSQDNYSRELKTKEHTIIVLENNYLKATFLPQFGGKLHSLFDKVNGKELLYVTKTISKQPAELLFGADCWGALEVERRRVSQEPEMCTHLDFGDISEEQIPWLSLLKNVTLGLHNPTKPPVSYMS